MMNEDVRPQVLSPLAAAQIQRAQMLVGNYEEMTKDGYAGCCRERAQLCGTSMEDAATYMTDALEFVRQNMGSRLAAIIYGAMGVTPHPCSPIYRAMNVHNDWINIDKEEIRGLAFDPGEPPDRLSRLGIMTVPQDGEPLHYLVNGFVNAPPIVLLDDAIMEAELNHISVEEMLEQYRMDEDSLLGSMLTPVRDPYVTSLLCHKTYTKELPVIAFHAELDQQERQISVTINPSWERRCLELLEQQQPSEWLAGPSMQ